MPESSTPKYLQVATYLRVLIEEGRVRPGGQLPTEAELCRRFGCSRGPVRQALAELVREGEIRRQRGAGSFVVRHGRKAPDRRRMLAAIVPNMENSEFARSIRALNFVANERGYSLLLGVTNDLLGIEQTFIDEIARHRVRGVIKFPTLIEKEEETRARLRKYGMSVVILNDFWTGLSADDSVAYDERAAVEMTVAHLVELGHRRIGMVETSLWPRSNAIDAFFKSLARHGLSHKKDQLLLYDDRNELPPVERLYGRSGPNPTALVTVYDVIAMRLIAQLRKFELRVPEDVSVANVNGAPTDMPLEVELTTALPPYRTMMEQALDLILDGPKRNHVGHLVFKPEFRTGGTTAPCRRSAPAAARGRATELALRVERR